MAIKVTYKVQSKENPSATFSSVDDCKSKLSIPAHSDLANVGEKQTKANEWAIDGDGNVTYASFYASESDRDAAKTAYQNKLTELGVTRKYFMTQVSSETM